MKVKRLTFFSFVLFLALSCGKPSQEFTSDGFEKVFSISNQVLSRTSDITISFLDEIKNSSIDKCITISPDLKGSWSLVDPKTIQFTHDGYFASDSSFDVTVDVGKLLGESANNLGFTRTFYVSPGFFTVSLSDPIFEKDNDDVCYVDITVNTDINTTTSEVLSILTATLDNVPCKIVYEKNETDTTHKLKILDIAKKSKPQNLAITYDANSIGFPGYGTASCTIPALDEFNVISTRLVSDKMVQFSFSESLNSKDDFRDSIIVTSEITNYTYSWSVDNNVLTITCSSREWPKDTVISFLPSLKSAKGHTLKTRFDYTVVLGWEKPSLAFTESKVILPSRSNPVVPISTKNLKGVIVEAIQIPHSNMLQFLQVNDFTGKNEITRVGTSVWKKAFDFDWNQSMKNYYVTRGLDLTELVNKYPDGMFQLRITFAKRHSMYETGDTVDSDLEFPADFVNFAISPYDEYWNNVSNQSDKYSYWRNSSDPNHPAYYISSYNSNAIETRNVIISQLALSAKVDSSGNVYVQAINILSGEPEKNVEVKLFNYAQSLLEQGATDSNGRYNISKSKDNVTFIQAKSGKDYAYIDLSNTPLSTSNFEVEGVVAYDAVKGFIYSERGVYRPGDNLHLCLIIQDLKNTLPKNIPITFSLEDPMGKVVDKQVLTESVNGFYKVTTKTNDVDPTGSWTARFKSGNNVWTKSLKVESIIPNKLSVDLQVAQGYFNSGNNSVTLKSEWLTGVKASNLKSELYVRYLSTNAPFESYPEHTFTNSNYFTSTSLKKIWEGYLDESGNAKFNLKLDAGKNVSGMLKAIFESRVYEPSGAYSIESKSLNFSPFTSYVGLKLPKSDDAYRECLYLDRTHTLNIVNLDESGKLLQTNSTVEVSIYKLDWRWWWTRDAYTQATYAEGKLAKSITKKTVNVKNGKATFDFSCSEWGRYLFLVRDIKSGHTASIVSYMDYSYWATRNASDVSGSANMLLLTSNKDKYSTDEMAEVTFSSNQNSSAYITVEKNGQVILQDLVKTVDGINTYKFKLDSGMAPNVYVHVDLVQGLQNISNNLPLRLYGIIPIMVEDSKTRLEPVIKTQESFAPNQTCKISISEKDGRPSTFTIAVVDEGLLGLTAFKTSNPWDYFYSKEASQLSSYDMFNYISTRLTGKLQTLITVGGSDDVMQEVSSKSAERFKPVVFYFGPFELKKGETKELEFTMPEYIGEVRVMAVCGDNLAYGVKEQKVKVKSDIMISPVLPRTLGVGETMELPVTVFNTTDKQQNISLILETNGVATVQELKTIALKPNSNETVRFSISPKIPGTVKTTFTAKAGNKLVFSSSNEIQVMSRGTPYQESQSLAIKPGQTITTSIKTVGETGSKKLTLEVSRTESIGVEKNLSSLLGYPHGCIEQITSKAFAQLYISKLLTVSDSTIQEIKASVKSVIARYPSYQISNGAFGYWQGDTQEHLWGSVYALHFLTEAKTFGYAVDNALYNNLANRVQQLAKAFSTTIIPYDMNTQAYRLYVLSLIGKADVGAMNRLVNEKSLSVNARCFLSLAYLNTGNKSQAQKIFSEITSEIPIYRNTGADFSSSIRDLSLMCLVSSKLNDASAASRFTSLTQTANKAYWLSTQESAWLLIVASQFLTNTASENIDYEIASGSFKIKESLKNTAISHSLEVIDGNQNISFTNKGQGTCFITLNYESRLSPGEETAQQNAISLDVKYLKDNAIVSPASLKMSDTIKARFSVKNTSLQNLEHLVLNIPIPTGWEISNERLGGEVGQKNYSYLDIRDEIVYVHFDLKTGEEKTFDFLATLAYAGEYFVPAVYCEAMYDADIKAMQNGVKISATSK